MNFYKKSKLFNREHWVIFWLRKLYLIIELGNNYYDLVNRDSSIDFWKGEKTVLGHEIRNMQNFKYQ